MTRGLVLDGDLLEAMIADRKRRGVDLHDANGTTSGYAGATWPRAVVSRAVELRRRSHTTVANNAPKRSATAWPSSIAATTSQRDSHESRFRRGRSLPCAILGLLAELGVFDNPQAHGRPGQIRTVSQVCSRHT